MIKKNQEYSLPHHNLSDKQKDKADIELKTLRFERLKNIGAEQKIYSDLISLKYNIIDYLELGLFSEKFKFSEYLKKYVSIVNISRRNLASDLGTHETKFSRIINDKENPGLGFLYRIEEHSNSILPASLLWQLVNRKMIREIENDKTEKKKQSKLVKNKLNLRIA